MKHRVKGRKLNRRTKHRQSLAKNLIIALINYGSIKTTEAKAKTIKSIIDKLIYKAQNKTVHSRRILVSFLHNKAAVNKLIDEIAPQFKKRVGGFTRIVRLGKRRGDDAIQVHLEFVKFTQTGLKPAKPKTTKVAKKTSKTKKTTSTTKKSTKTSK